MPESEEKLEDDVRMKSKKILVSCW